ncbi:MAG TPA: glycosyltransferase, partial [Polyangiaceae bacterium]|nr:glycosyltransferase [Polyangiaceae bacterium]
MRIAILTTSYPQWDGDAAGHFVAADALELVRQGHSVSVFCPRDPQFGWCHPDPQTANPAVFSADAHGACGFPGVLPRIRARPWRLLGLLSWLWSARRWLKTHGPFDRLICQWLFPSAWPLARYTRNSVAKLECVVHGSDARLLARLPRPVQRSIVRGLLQRGAHFRCVSEELAQIVWQAVDFRAATAARALRAELEARIYVHPPALEVEVPLSRSAARKQLNVITPAPLVVIASRLIASKRVDVALNALRLAGITDIVVLGDGPEQRTLARRYPEVRFMG